MFANKQDFLVASTDSEKVKLLLAQQQNSDSLSIFNADMPPEASPKPSASATPEQAKADASAAAIHVRNLKVESTKSIAALSPELASLVKCFL